MYSVPCDAASPLVLGFFPVSKGRVVGPLDCLPDLERTLIFWPSTASACSRRKVILFPIPRNFLPASLVMKPVTVAPGGITMVSPTLNPSATVKRSAKPSCPSAATSSDRTIRKGRASLTVTGTVWITGRRGAAAVSGVVLGVGVGLAGGGVVGGVVVATAGW